MARIFAPPAFVAAEVSVKLLDALRALPEDVVVLVEFMSPGPDGRQVDVAVLGHNGVDVIEVKNKRGTVVADDHGPWRILEDDGRTSEIPLNTFRGRSENPWDQADRTSKDFEQGIRTKYGYPRDAKVFPSVLVPVRRAEARIGRRSFVNGLNGVEDFQNGLRSLRVQSGHEVWSYPKRLQLAERLGLCEEGIATVTGSVVSAATRVPLPGMRMRVGGVSVATDDAGSFSFAVPAGIHAIEVDVPGAPEPWTFDKSFAQGATKGWEIPVSVASAQVPVMSGDDVAEVIKKHVAKLEGDYDALYELIADQLGRLPTQPPQVVAPSAPSGEVDAVLRELRAMLKEFEKARQAESTPERIGTIERGMELVLALEKARVDELQAIVPDTAVHRPIRAAGSDWDFSDAEAVDVEVREVRAEAPPQATVVAQPPDGATPVRRSRRPLRVAAGALVVLLAAGVWAWRSDLAILEPRDGGAATSAAVPADRADGGPSAPLMPGQPLAASTATQSAQDAAARSLPGVPIGAPIVASGAGVPPTNSSDCPASHPIKGNIAASGERIFHVSGQEFFAATRPEVCFATAEDARADGFRASLR